MPDTLEPPPSYEALSMKHIKTSHFPSNSPTPTKVDGTTLELEAVYKHLGRDDRVRVIILTRPGCTFCAGADLDAGFLKGEIKDVAVPGGILEHRDSAGCVTMAMHKCPKPTIVAINRPAVGVGITVTLPAAIRVAYKDAKIRFVFNHRGLIMEGASAFFLPRLIGHPRAMHLVTTGAVYPASHPLVSTLFSEVLSTPEAAVARAIKLATEITEHTPSVSTAVMRDLMWRAPASAEETYLP